MTVTIDTDGWIREAMGIHFTHRSWGAFQQKPRQIVLHGTAWPAGTAQIIATEWATSTGDASAHIIINKDGSYVQGISLNWTAWANCCLTDSPYTGAKWDRRLLEGNQNHWSIAIEHCKDDKDRNSDVLTPEQQATSFELVKAICDYHSIPKKVIEYSDISQGGIIRHKDIDAENRPYCPGPYPLGELQQYLGEGTMPDTFNQMIIELWNSMTDYFKAQNAPLPPRDTAIFNSWRQELISGHFRGLPLTGEYNTVDQQGEQIVAQNYSGGVCRWYPKSGVVVWL